MHLIVESMIYDDLEKIRDFFRREHWYRFSHIDGKQESWGLKDHGIDVGHFILFLDGNMLNTAKFISYVHSLMNRDFDDTIGM